MSANPIKTYFVSLDGEPILEPCQIWWSPDRRSKSFLQIGDQPEIKVWAVRGWGWKAEVVYCYTKKSKIPKRHRRVSHE